MTIPNAEILQALHLGTLDPSGRNLTAQIIASSNDVTLNSTYTLGNTLR